MGVQAEGLQLLSKVWCGLGDFTQLVLPGNMIANINQMVVEDFWRGVDDDLDWVVTFYA